MVQPGVDAEAPVAGGQCSYQPLRQCSCYYSSLRDTPVQTQHFFRCESLPQLTLEWKLFVWDAIGPL